MFGNVFHDFLGILKVKSYFINIIDDIQNLARDQFQGSRHPTQFNFIASTDDFYGLAVSGSVRSRHLAWLPNHLQTLNYPL